MSETYQNNKTKSVAIALAIIVLLSGGAYWFAQSDAHMDHAAGAQAKSEPQRPKYHCPMHPAVTSDEPGTCPICHMELQLIDYESEDAHAGHDHSQESQAAGAAIVTEEGTPSTGTVEGRSGFKLTPERQQIIGVTKAHVEKRKLESEIRATGRVAFDPELFTAVEEYRQALASSSTMADSPYPTLKNQSRGLVQSAKMKLKLMGLTDEEIRRVARGSSDPMNLLLPEGKAWVYAEIFEYEVQGVKPGQAIEATAPSIPGETFKGKVSSISPILDAPTRTVRVRAEVPDPKGLLRPDTFLNVRIINDLGERLAVPEDSVMFTGDNAYAFVVKGEGHFEPTPVKVGAKTGKYYEILSGLEEGQTVVTGANFLIDSESRLRSVAEPKKPSLHEAHK